MNPLRCRLGTGTGTGTGTVKKPAYLPYYRYLKLPGTINRKFLTSKRIISLTFEAPEEYSSPAKNADEIQHYFGHFAWFGM
jgi:hypothetical protein